MSKTIVSSVVEMEALFAANSIGPKTEAAKSVRKVRSKLLTAEETAILSHYVVHESWEGYVDPNIPGMLECLGGIQKAQSGDPIFLVIGGESFVAKRNLNNRKRTLSRIKPITKDGTYSNLMVRGLFATLATDGFCYDWDGQIQTAQHRIDAALEAKRTNPDLVLPLFKVILGNPSQLRDWMDKAKTRTATDDDTVDESAMPLDLVQLVNLHVSGLTTATDKQMDERTALLKIRSKVTETIQRRFQGMDIYPTGAKQNFEDKVATIERCGLVTVSRFESEIVTMEEQEVFALEYLIAKVVATGRGQSGKVDALWTNYFSPAIVASGIVLASNDESWLESAIEENAPFDSSMTIEEKAETRLQAKASLTSPDSAIRIDFELADKVLTLLSQSTDKEGGGPLGDCLSNLAKSIAKHKVDTDGKDRLYKSQSIASMSAFVQLVKNIQSDNLSENIFTTYRKREGEYSPEYRCFGGKDFGYVNTKKSAK